jgi:hypothetical protein
MHCLLQSNLLLVFCIYLLYNLPEIEETTYKSRDKELSESEISELIAFSELNF